MEIVIRKIKFRYVYQHKENKKRFYHLILSLEDIENNILDLGRTERKDEWDLISIDEYVGLKDKNDISIYENDIIRIYIEDNCVNTIVFFC